jgi:SAM-dependent methyltransferase
MGGHSRMNATISMSEIQEAPGPGTERVACNLCRAVDATELYRRSDFRFEVDAIEWPLVKCKRCGLAYVNPRPTPDAIWRYYPAFYYEHRDQTVLKVRYELQAQRLANLTPGSLLDIGCANGDWLKLMRDRGWRVAGLEPSPNSDNPHRLDIRKAAIETADYPAESFDVITAWAVFEHLHDPMSAFRHVARWLKPGGYLIIAVTNVRSIASRLAYQEDIPRHLHVFSERTLKQYASAVGLELSCVDHDTRLFGGSGRGVVRVRLYQMLGVQPLVYFRAMRLPLAERVRRYPVLALGGVPIALLERLFLPDWLVRRLRLSGTVVSTMRKPSAGAMLPLSRTMSSAKEDGVHA